MTDILDGPRTDRRHHVDSMLMRESLLDKQVMASTESEVVRMLPNVHVVKIGAGFTDPDLYAEPRFVEHGRMQLAGDLP